MKRILSLLLTLALICPLLPAALAAESVLPMTQEEYERQYKILNPAYTGSQTERETMVEAYKIYLTDAYSTAHPGELEALTLETLLAQRGYKDLEEYRTYLEWNGQDPGVTEKEIRRELIYRYAQGRDTMARVRMEAGAYRQGFPQLWADFAANADFEAHRQPGESKEDRMGWIYAQTELEFREALFVDYVRTHYQGWTGGTEAIPAPARPVTPSAPSWVAEEGYLVFPEDPAYQPGNWDYICALRQQAEEGGLLDYEGRDWAEGSPAQCYETALIRLKCAENYGDDDFEAKAAFLSAGRAFHAAESGWYDRNRGRDETYYRLSVEKYRAYVLYHPEYSESLGRGLVPALDVLGMTLDDFFDAPYMGRVSPADRAVVAALVEEYREVYDREKDRITVELDGVPLNMDVAPQVRDQRVMVPLRAIAEALGAEVTWDPETNGVTLTRADRRVSMTIGRTSATVDGKRITMDVAPYAERDRTYVPARYVSEFFGQSVVWNGEERTVEIGEDKTAWAESGLEERLLPMGALLGFLEGGDPGRFGFYPRPPYTETVNSQSGVKENRAVAPFDLCRETLSETWGIPDRETLLETVEELRRNGDQKEFQAAADEVRGLSDWQIDGRTEKLSDVDKYMWPRTKALAKKWGKTGIRAWDLCRAAALTEWGYTAGYVTYPEAMELLEPMAAELAERFDSWDKVYENFLEGYYWCLREDLGDKTVWDTDLGMAYQYLKNSPDTRSLFDGKLLDKTP